MPYVHCLCVWGGGEGRSGPWRYWLCNVFVILKSLRITAICPLEGGETYLQRRASTGPHSFPQVFVCLFVCFLQRVLPHLIFVTILWSRYQLHWMIWETEVSQFQKRIWPVTLSFQVGQAGPTPQSSWLPAWGSGLATATVLCWPRTETLFCGQSHSLTRRNEKSLDHSQEKSEG